jgi:hypothetical protein
MKNAVPKKSEKIKSNEIPDLDFYAVTKDLPGEKWAELTFTDRPYEISNYGRLKSYALKETGVILRNRKTSDYLTVTLKVLKQKKNFFIHKLVAENFIPKENEKQNFVIHIDNDRQNNYFENLKWANPKETFVHTEKFNKKLHLKFRKNKTSNAKINKKNAELIRKMLEQGIVQAKIAKIFGISEMQVTRIKRNENWVSKDLPDYTTEGIIRRNRKK